MMEVRLEPWIAIVESLVHTGDDWKALCCSWFLFNVVSALQPSDNSSPKHSLQVHERVLALMTRMLLWYESEELSGNEAIVKVWNDITFSPAVRSRIAAYLPAILCQIRVVRPPPPPPQPTNAVVGLVKAVTRSAGKQVGGVMAAKNVKAAVATIVPSTELRLPSRRLLNMSPVSRLSSKALVDGLCVCQLLGEGDTIHELGLKTAQSKLEQFNIDNSWKAPKDESTVYYGSLLPDIYYDGYQSVCAHYYTLDKWKVRPVGQHDQAVKEEAVIGLLIFAIEIAAAATDTLHRVAVPNPEMLKEYATWTTTDLLKQAKQPTLCPATAVQQDPPPPALLVSPPTDSRLAMYLAIVNSFCVLSKLTYCHHLTMQLARLMCRRHRQLLLTPVGFHFFAQLFLSNNLDYDLEDALCPLEVDLRAVAVRCVEESELQLLYRLLLLMKLRWRSEAMREEIVRELVENTGGLYHHEAMEKLVDLHAWLQRHTTDIQRMCVTAVQAEQQQPEEKSAADATPMVLQELIHQLLDGGDWAQEWKNECARQENEWEMADKERKERVAAAEADDRAIDDKDEEHYPPMLRYALPAIDQFLLDAYPDSSHVRLPHTDTVQSATHIRQLLIELALLHIRQQRIVQVLWSPTRTVQQWSVSKLRQQRKESTGQAIGPDSDTDESDEFMFDESDLQQLDGSAVNRGPVGGDEGDEDDMEEEEKSDEAK